MVFCIDVDDPVPWTGTHHAMWAGCKVWFQYRMLVTRGPARSGTPPNLRLWWEAVYDIWFVLDPIATQHALSRCILIQLGFLQGPFISNIKFQSGSLIYMVQQRDVADWHEPNANPELDLCPTWRLLQKSERWMSVRIARACKRSFDPLLLWDFQLYDTICVLKHVFQHERMSVTRNRKHAWPLRIGDELMIWLLSQDRIVRLLSQNESSDQNLTLPRQSIKDLGFCRANLPRTTKEFHLVPWADVGKNVFLVSFRETIQISTLRNFRQVLLRRSRVPVMGTSSSRNLWLWCIECLYWLSSIRAQVYQVSESNVRRHKISETNMCRSYPRGWL